MAIYLHHDTRCTRTGPAVTCPCCAELVAALEMAGGRR